MSTKANVLGGNRYGLLCECLERSTSLKWPVADDRQSSMSSLLPMQMSIDAGLTCSEMVGFSRVLCSVLSSTSFNGTDIISLCSCGDFSVD